MNNFSTLAAPALPIIHKVNYFKLQEKNPSFAAIRFILECCEKLEGEHFL